MKTTITITAETVEGGINYKVNHEGDCLTQHMVNELRNTLYKYLEALSVLAQVEDSLPIMKQRRKEVKQKGKEAEAIVEAANADGFTSKDSEDIPIPF